MDETDKGILNEIQTGFPIVPRPYEEIGRRLNLREQEVMERISKLKAEGIIRRIGGNFHSHRLNFTSTLCAAKVPNEKVDCFVEVVNGYPGVTHNYLRNHGYNIWFTFIAQNMTHIEEALKMISKKTGVSDILNLPAIKVYKIRVDFEL